MKKIVALLLALVMVFALCGCGKSEDEVKSEMYEDASIPDLYSFYESYKQNKVSATKEYVGKAYKMRAFVNAIEEDFVILEPMTPLPSEIGILIKIPMKNEDIMKLSVDQIVDIKGKLDEIKEGNETLTFLFNKKYVMNDIIEIDGYINEVNGIDNPNDGMTYIEINESIGPKYMHLGFCLYTYDDEVELMKINNEQKIIEGADITITGKAFFTKGYRQDYGHFNAEIDSIDTIKILSY